MAKKTKISLMELLYFIRDEKSYADVQLAIRQSGKSASDIEWMLKLAANFAGNLATQAHTAEQNTN